MIENERADTPNFNTQFEYHYTRGGSGVIGAVCRLFERGTFILGEGDALLPIQEAYLAWKKEAGK